MSVKEMETLVEQAHKEKDIADEAKKEEGGNE